MTRRQRRKQKRLVRTVRPQPSFEALEDRRLLSADDPFAILREAILAGGGQASFPISLRAQDFSFIGSQTSLRLQLKPSAASAFDPALIELRNSAATLVAPTTSFDDNVNNVFTAVYAVGVGDFSITVGAGAASGNFDLEASLSSDFDGTARVDGLDFLQWQREFGSAPAIRGSGADANVSGGVDSGDFGFWKGAFGASTSVRPLTLSLDSPNLIYFPPTDSFVTSSANATITGQTLPNLTVKVDNNGDLDFNDATGVTDPSGAFSVNVPIPVGTTPIRVRVEDAFGQRREQSVSVTRDPLFHGEPLVYASLLSDTGRLSTDRITNNASVTGLVAADESIIALRAGLDTINESLFVDITPQYGAGLFTIPTAVLESINGGPLTDGAHTLRIQAQGAIDGWSRAFEIQFTLDATAPTTTFLDLSITSDTGVLGDQTTNAGRVTLTGQSEGGATIELLLGGLSALASNAGTFQFPGVDLAVGDNVLNVTATDIAGNAFQFDTTIHRVVEAQQQDPVLRWNQALLEAIRLDASPPPIASRGMAMVHGAIYDAVNAIEGLPGFYVALAAPTSASAEAGVAGAAHQVLSYLYPGQQAYLDSVLTASLTQVPDGPSETDGLTFGRSVGDAIIAMRLHDGWDDFVDHVPGSGPGAWQPTPPMYMEAMLPQWADLQPFAMTSSDQFQPAGPPDLTSQEWADAYNEVKDYGRIDSTLRSADQKQIARFWADGPGTYTPPGHWNQIAVQAAQQVGNSLLDNARLFAQLNVAMADAAIVSWNAKYAFEFWRPITAIQAGDTDGNAATIADPDWTPLIISPNFPEYTSGHSTFSGAAAAVLAASFGDNYAFSATSFGLPGVTRNFSSFDAAADEAGQSRIYGGIHFQFSNQDGQAAGRELAAYVLDAFAASADLLPPSIVIASPPSDHVASNNITVIGRVLDNLSGVASLEVQVDSGAFVAAPFDAQGNFSVPTAFAVNGTADGVHTLRFRAADFEGNASSLTEFSFTLDTVAPALVVTTPANASVLTFETLLSGTVGGTGSPLTSLTYAFDGGDAMPFLASPAGGDFDVPVDLSHLSSGAHVFTVSARDAAGNVTSIVRNVSLAAPIPLMVTEFTPLNGANDVGSTFRPQVFFSRPVNTATLTANSFFATDTTGATIPATIVPSADGTFAWLFFTNPMPGASTITIHVVGNSILAAGDGQALDADGDGLAGGTLTYQFSTVSLAPLANTSLTGRVFDPGADLKPMTFDDIRAGADGALHTPDDVFLNPLGGVKVFILGLENQFVYTDAQGNFTLPAVPSGNVKLAIDGRTATNAPSGFYFPEMVMDLELEVGQINTVMGTMGTRDQREANLDRPEVYLPRLATSILQQASDTEVTMVGVDATSAPNLTPEERAQLVLEVQPGTLIGPDGEPLTGASAQIGISTVPPELVRDMLPPGVLQHTFDITIQAPNAATFSTPLEMTFPNVFNADPGSKLNFLSFDHTTGRLVIEGTATVSADGLSVVTDPGTGITKPGWHGLTAPGSPINDRARLNDSDRDTSDYNCDPAMEAAALLTAAAVQAFYLLKGAPTAASHLAHFLSGSGSSISHGLGSSISNLVKADALFISSHKSLESAVASQLNAMIRSDVDPTNEDFQAFLDRAKRNPEFVYESGPYPSASDLVYAIRGTQGVSVGGHIEIVLVDGKPFWQGSLSYRIVDYYGFGVDDASLDGLAGFATSQMRYLQTHCDAKAFPVEILVEMPFRFIAVLPSAEPSEINLTREIRLNAAGEPALMLDGDPTVLPPAVKSGSMNTRLYYRYFFDNGTELLGRGDPAGSLAGFSTAESTYRLVVFDPQTNSTASVQSTTARSGVSSGIALRKSPVHLVQVPEIDSDDDGISDIAEMAVGTNPDVKDTDGDGLSDYSEVQQDLDPLGGRVPPTGVLSSLLVKGEANHIIVNGATGVDERYTAFVATGSYGVSIVDATRVSQPLVLGELDLLGDSTDIDVDSRLGIAAVAANSGGLHLVSVTDPTRPALIRSLNAQAGQVEIIDGVAYATVGSEFHSFDLLTGERLQVLSLGGSNIIRIAREGSYLFTLDSANTLRAIEVSASVMTALGSLSMPAGGGNLFVGDGIAYVGAGAGFATADVSNPNSLALISGVDAANIEGSAVVSNGSGLAVAVGKVLGPNGPINALDVLDVSDPANTAAFVTRYSLPAAPQSVAIGAGIAFVADGTGGLQIVNYRAFDNLGVPPTVSITSAITDLDPDTPGIQVLEGSTITVRSMITDDVQVRNVELLVNGQVLLNDVSFPFELSAILPNIVEAGSSTANVQVRATDTGGNIGLSNVLLVSLQADPTAPTIVSSTPDVGETMRLGQRKLSFDFSEAIAAAVVVPENFELQLVGGGTIAPQSIQLLNYDRRIEITYPTLPVGNYQLVIHAATVTDRAGNSLGGSDIVRSVNVTSIDPLAEELIGYWKFDGNGSDDSMSDRDVAQTGTEAYAAGLIGQAAQLDRFNHVVRPADDVEYEFGSEDFTVQVWVKVDRIESEQVLIEKWDGSAGWTVALRGENDLLTHIITDSGDVVLNTTPFAYVGVAPGTWHQFGIRRAGNVLSLLFNGGVVRQTTLNGTLMPTVSPLNIGSRNGDKPTYGAFDEAAIWSRALSDDELAQLYNNRAGFAIPANLGPDDTPPSIVGVNPSDGAVVSPGPRTIDVQFSEAMAAATMSPNAIQLRNGAGEVVTPSSFQFIDNNRLVRLSYTSLGVGSYQLTIHSSSLTDISGNALGSTDSIHSFAVMDTDPLTVGLLGYWKFDGGGADTANFDRDLNIAGGAGFTTGLIDQSLDLHGNPSQFAMRTVSDASYNFGTADFTIQIWVNYNTTAGEQVLIEKFDFQGFRGWTLTKMDDNRLRFFSTFNLDSPIQNLSTGQWHQIVVRRSDSAFSMWLDSSLIGTADNPSNFQDATEPLLIGKRTDTDGRGFAVNGRLDESAIWNRALTNAEISQLYNGGSGWAIPIVATQAAVSSQLTVSDAEADGDEIIDTRSIETVLSIWPVVGLDSDANLAPRRAGFSSYSPPLFQTRADRTRVNARDFFDWNQQVSAEDAYFTSSSNQRHRRWADSDILPYEWMSDDRQPRMRQMVSVDDVDQVMEELFVD